jgi:hypothetical protein
VKDDYCGSIINFQYCKCAFHNECCEEVGLSSGSAHQCVLTEFREWNRERIQLQEWKVKEYQRVHGMLEDQCKEVK